MSNGKLGERLPSKKLRDDLTLGYRGRSEPASVEMVANLWAHMVLIQDTLVMNMHRMANPTPENLKQYYDVMQETLTSLSDGIRAFGDKTLPGGGGDA